MVVTIGAWVGAICILEPRDAAKHPTIYRKAPTRKNYLTQNVDTIRVEKPWPDICLRLWV